MDNIELRTFASSDLVSMQTSTMKIERIVKEIQKEANGLTQIKSESLITKLNDFEASADQLRRLIFDYVRHLQN